MYSISLLLTIHSLLISFNLALYVAIRMKRQKYIHTYIHKLKTTGILLIMFHSKKEILAILEYHGKLTIHTTICKVQVVSSYGRTHPHTTNFIFQHTSQTKMASTTRTTTMTCTTTITTFSKAHGAPPPTLEKTSRVPQPPPPKSMELLIPLKHSFKSKF